MVTSGATEGSEGLMGKVMLSINLSLDGFADHTVAVAADDELHDFFSGLLDLTEVAIFGRVTYELMESYWPRAHEDPSATKGMLDFATKFNAIPKVVFSKTLKSVMWNNTRLVRVNFGRTSCWHEASAWQAHFTGVA